MTPSAQLARGLVSRLFLVAAGTLLWIVWTPAAWAQSADRVLGPVDPNARVTMPGHHPYWASPQNDAGAAPADLALEHLTLILARSPQAQQAFEQFLQNQQDPESSEYHHWLKPIEVGERFGVSVRDIAAVSDWLRSQGLRVDSISNSHVRINFSGPAAAVGSAFGGEVHYFRVNGKQWMSIAADPQIPAALAPVIKAIHGLYTIEDHPAHKGVVGYFSADGAQPNFTLSNGSHFIAPADFATIYDVNSVYDGGINGAGQTIAIIGRARVYNPDIENFQSLSGLATKDPITIIPTNGLDPGPPASSGGASEDQLEATLDVTRSGSVAPGATIDLVVSATTGGVNGIRIAAAYLVDTAPVLAHVMSISFGNCETNAGQAGVSFWDNLFSQAAAEGISVFVSSGDAGAAGCDTNFQTPPASQILSPNYICSSSYATCVGGTEFADFTNPSQYWGPTNASNLGSALSYIPEGGWNEPTTSSGGFQAAASGGGFSAFIPTPSWQTGTGVPAARAGRYTPDVSFSSSAHDGYFACLAARNASCVVQNGSFSFESFEGTSAAAPDMAGIAALLNQQQGGPQGNLNPTLYKLAANSGNAFHDVTVASSGVSNCSVSTPSMCNNSTPSPTALTGGLAGYVVGMGYDEVTGLGSLDVANFLASWSAVRGLPPATTTMLTSDSPAIIFGSFITFFALVTTTGSIPPTGPVTFLDGTTQLASATLKAGGFATFVTSSLALGTHSITAVYGGDAHNAGSTSAALTVSVASSSLPIPVVTALSPSSATALGSPFTLTVYGSNFVSAAYVLWNSSYRDTTAVSSSELHASILPIDIATPGVASVQVIDYGGDTSNPLPFDVLLPPLRFHSLTPCRIVDTRPGNGPNGPLAGPAIAARASRDFPILSSPCLSGVPSTVAAYSVNVSVSPWGILGYATIYPTGEAPPNASTLNSLDGGIKANAAIVPAGTNGSVSVWATDTTDVWLDINGYFVPASQDSTALAFFPLKGGPCRIVDTRVPKGTNDLLHGPWLQPQEYRSFPLPSTTNCTTLPTDGSAQAYSLNATVVPWSTLGYLQLYPTGQTGVNTSTLNATNGPLLSANDQKVQALTANAAIVPAGTGGAITAFVTDNTDLIIDINGYFGPSTSGNGLSLYMLPASAQPPCRVLDTRISTNGGFVGTFTVDTTASPCGILPEAQAVVLNTTVIPWFALGYLELWPYGDPAPNPPVSTLNALQEKNAMGQELITSNMAIAPTSTSVPSSGSSGEINFYATDPTQLVLDASGYFASGTPP